MKIYRHCESDKKLWLNTRSLLKNIKSSKYIYLKLDLLYDFQQIPKIWESNCGILWCSAWLSHQLWSYAFSEWRHLPLLYLHWYNIYLVQLQLTKYHHLQQISELILAWRNFLLFTFYFCPPWLRHVSGNFSRQDRKFHNGCLSAGNPRLNFYNYFCKSWCNVLKW